MRPSAVNQNQRSRHCLRWSDFFSNLPDINISSLSCSPRLMTRFISSDALSFCEDSVRAHSLTHVMRSAFQRFLCPPGRATRGVQGTCTTHSLSTIRVAIVNVNVLASRSSNPYRYMYYMKCVYLYTHRMHLPSRERPVESIQAAISGMHACMQPCG